MLESSSKREVKLRRTTHVSWVTDGKAKIQTHGSTHHHNSQPQPPVIEITRRRVEVGSACWVEVEVSSIDEASVIENGKSERVGDPKSIFQT